MAVVNNSKISLEYEGTLEDGQVFDSTTHGDHSHAFEFVVGSGQVIKGFDQAVLGMEKGQEKEFDLAPEDAYGSYNDELKRDIPRSAFPQNQELKKGMTLLMGTPDGRKFPIRIIDANESVVTIDLNHPLAGKKLHFKIKVVDIK